MYRRAWAALRLAASNGDRGDRKWIRLGTYRGQGVQGVALLYIHLFRGDKAHEQTKDALLQPIPSRASVPPADSAGWAPDPEKATGKADPKSLPSGRAHREMISLLPRHARQTVSSSPPSFPLQRLLRAGEDERHALRDPRVFTTAGRQIVLPPPNGPTGAAPDGPPSAPRHGREDARVVRN